MGRSRFMKDKNWVDPQGRKGKVSQLDKDNSADLHALDQRASSAAEMAQRVGQGGFCG